VKRALPSLAGQPLEGQRAFVRVDFNVPLDQGKVTDATRVRAAVPTITWLRERGCRVVLASHLGRPKGIPRPELSLQPVVRLLETELGVPVDFRSDLGAETARATQRLGRGQVLLLENTRFWPGEETNDLELAQMFADLSDIYVNDAFGTAHRAHASTEGVAHLVKPAVAGLLMARELTYLEATLEHPQRPYLAILGGAKISGKIDVIDALLDRVDTVLIGGAMACTFFLAMGLEVGNSLVEEDRVEMATNLLDRAGDRLVLPETVVVAQALRSDVRWKEVPNDAVEPGWSVYDIGSAAAATFASHIGGARTILWNGPMGVFETPPFHEGTMAIAHSMAAATKSGSVTVVGGGDSAAAMNMAGLEREVSHVSTGGGAALKLLEGKVLPAIAALDDV
jgi:phosphoglycerate kinase